jgi:hypothetical protein
MNELKIIFYIIAGIFKLIFWIVRSIVRLITLGYRKFVEVGTAELERRKQEADARAPSRIKAQTMKRAPDARATPNVTSLYAKRTKELSEEARRLAELAAERENTRRFVVTLEAIDERSAEIMARARRSGVDLKQLERDVKRDEVLLELVADLITERRTSGLAALIADTDALATACYAPIVEYCANRRIALSSDRAATIVGGDKIYFLSVDDPTGLAAIVLPDIFANELIAWPAIAHEIAHDFYRSVDQLPSQLAKALSLGKEIGLPSFNGDQRAFARGLQQVPDRATAAWREELFADAFGTMMMGPAYVETMAALFATPKDPAASTVIARGEGAPIYEEHPPGHVRVVVACRLLGQMGYGKVADELERRWRARHQGPTTLYVPLADGRYAVVPEGPTLERAASVGEHLYLTGLPCLRGQPLRSIPGLDFGPREHATANRIAADLADEKPVDVMDARVLVAGAVLARVARPDRAIDIYALARAAIEGVREAQEPVEVDLGHLAPQAVREAFLVGQILGPPVARRLMRRS